MFRAGVYIGWVGYLNLGDEVLYDLCRARYPSIFWSLFDTVDYTARPSQFLHRSTRDFHHFVAQLREQMATQRRLRSYARKALHELVRRMGSEVGVCSGGTFINRNEGALRAYTQLRRRIGRPVPTFATGVAFIDFWKRREKGWMDRRKEWVAALAELPVVGVRQRGLIERISGLISQLNGKRTELCRRMCRLMNTFENYCRTIEPLLLEPVLDLRFASHPPDPVC